MESQIVASVKEAVEKCHVLHHGAMVAESETNIFSRLLIKANIAETQRKSDPIMKFLQTETVKLGELATQRQAIETELQGARMVQTKK